MKKLILISTIALLMFGSCSSLQVVSDYDKTVDFSQYKTYSFYGWAKDSDKLLNDLDKKRFEKAFAEEFDKRGLQFAKEGGDLVVSLYIVTKQKQETTATTTTMGGRGYYGGGYYGYGPGWGWGSGMSTTSYNTYDYTEGTLICDVFDAKEKKLIWEGIGKGTIDDNPSNRDTTIPKAVTKIMTQYPVQPLEQEK